MCISSVMANSSSIVTPKNTDSLGSSSMSGVLRPFSHLLTAWPVTCSSCASCSCVMPLSVRSARILFPSSMKSPHASNSGR